MEHSIGHRIKQFREKLQLSQQEFGNRIGLERSNYSYIESGKSIPTGKTLIEIVNVFRIDANYLFSKDLNWVNAYLNAYPSSLPNTVQILEEKGGHHNKKAPQNVNPIVNLNVNPSLSPAVVTIDSSGTENIVLVHTKAAASYPIRYLEPEFYGELNAFSLPGDEYRHGVFRAFEISGDSMFDTLQAGDVVVARFLDRGYQDVRDGYVHIIVTDEEVLIKRVLNRVKSAQKLILQSDNSAYGNITLHINDVKELWLVKGRITMHLPNRNRDIMKTLDELQARITVVESQIAKE